MKPHRARILAMQAVYQLDFHPEGTLTFKSFPWIDYELPEDEKAFAGKIIQGVQDNITIIDDFIRKHSKNWIFERISPVNKAILRISIYQLMKMADEVPYRVVIDEALKITRKYSDEASTSYINALLDVIWKEVK